MKRFGLIGKHLAHSFSPAYFHQKFEREGIDASYEVAELPEIERFPAWLDTADVSGLNVTVPYKEAIIPYLDELDPVAAEIGAVNTIRIKEGRAKGYNTDWIGFRDTLLPLLPEGPVEALVFGTGGASKAICYALSQLGISFLPVSRNTPGFISYEELSEKQAAARQVWVHTTPVGMFPNTEERIPIPVDVLTPDHVVYDLIYNPEKTRLLQEAEARGARIQNGLGMLHKQAEATWDIWTTQGV